MSVGAPQPVPQREVLAVVVVEEEVVVGVVGRAVDHARQGVGDPVVPVVDGDGPDVDEDVEDQVEHLVQGEEEGVDVVGQPLQEAVHRVEGVAGEGRGDLPQVVRFVEHLRGRGSRRSLQNYIRGFVGRRFRTEHPVVCVCLSATPRGACLKLCCV